MKKRVNIFRKVVLVACILFLAGAFFTITIGQELPYEFKSQGLSNNFYDTIFGGIPISILCTLFYTVRAHSSYLMNIMVVLCTLLATYLSFVIIMGVMFSVGFAVWDEAPYRYRQIQTNTIVHKQRMELGVFGSGGYRYVIQEPYLHFWNKVTEVDSSYVMTPGWIKELSSR